MKQLLFLLLLLVVHLRLDAQDKKMTIDNQTPGWLSSLLTYPQQKTIEDLTITGYVNATDMSFVSNLIKNYNLKVLDLSKVNTITNGKEHFIWDNFLSTGTDKKLQRLRLPLIVEGRIPSTTSGTRYIINSNVDTLEVGWEDFSVLGDFNSEDLSPFKEVNYINLLDGVRVIPLRCFAKCYLGFISLPNTITHISGMAFKASSNFNEPFVFPDSAEYIGRYPLVYDNYYRHYYRGNSWREKLPKISSSYFSFPLNLKLYNSLTYSTYTNSDTKEIFPEHEFASDTIVIHEKCDTMYAILKAKVAFFYNPKPVEFMRHTDLWIDTLYVPEGSLSEYQNNWVYRDALNKRVNGYGYGQIGDIKEMKSVKDISIRIENNSLYVGDSLRLTTHITPVDATDKTVYWTSSNTDVAEISGDGTVYAKSYGSVEITVTSKDGEHKASCTLHIYEHTTGIEVIKKISIPINSTYPLVATPQPVGETDGNIKFSSDNSTIVSVDEEGMLTARKKGVCNITVTTIDGNHSAKCEVTVTQPVEALLLEKHSVNMKVGEKGNISALIYPTDADDASVVWESSNENIAKVDTNGIITANKPGETWIRAISKDNSEAKDSCKVNVAQPASGIYLNYTNYELDEIGESVELKAFVTPDDASNKNVRWTSTNESVCVVSNGIVFGVGYGTSVIIANTEDGGYLALCTITVTNTTDITSTEYNNSSLNQIFNLDGTKVSRLQKGLNIIHLSDGTVKKVMVK